MSGRTDHSAATPDIHPTLTRDPFDALNQQALDFMKQIEKAWLFASEVYKATGVAMRLTAHGGSSIWLSAWPYGVSLSPFEASWVNVPVDHWRLSHSKGIDWMPRAEALKRVKAAIRKAKKEAAK